MTRLTVIAALCLVLAGCGHAAKPDPEVVVRTVTVPVPAKCDVPRPNLDGYPDTEAALKGAANLFERVKLLMEARKIRGANEAKLWAYGDGCAGRAP